MGRDVLPAIPLASPAAFLATAARFGGPSLRKLPAFGGLLLRYWAFEPLRLAERLRDRDLDQYALRADPIFVVGHWRSGTTYLQELLNADRRFTTTTLYNTLFADFSGVTREWLKPLMNRTARMLSLPHNLQRQSLSLDRMGEGDVGLCCQLSPYAYTWGHIYPQQFEEWLERSVLDPSPEFVEGWLAHLDRYMRKLSRDAGGKRVVMKSPGDTGRVALLAERYPDARFVYIHRDPISVFHSSRHLWSVIRSEFAVQTLPDHDVDEIILRTYRRLLRSYLEQRSSIAEGHLLEIGYEELLGDPSGGLARIYEALDLGSPPPATAEDYAPHSYDTPPDLEARIRDEWGFAFTEWR